MIRSGFVQLLVASSLLALPIVACGVDEPTGETEQDLSASGKKLIGAYHFSDSTQQVPTLDGLVLTGDKVSSTTNRFFADIYVGKTCEPVPGVGCSTVERVEGKFKATKTTITLTPDDDLWADFFGKFKYKKTADTFTLSKTDGTEHTLSVAESYCSAESAFGDCSGQGLIVPACFPLTFTCSEANTCDFKCGQPNDTCDGFAGVACGEGEFCVHPEGSCGGADIAGSCASVDKCTKELRHVCGCDGETYTNACYALRDGVQIDHEGFCE